MDIQRSNFKNNDWGTTPDLRNKDEFTQVSAWINEAKKRKNQPERQAEAVATAIRLYGENYKDQICSQENGIPEGYVGEVEYVLPDRLTSNLPGINQGTVTMVKCGNEAEASDDSGWGDGDSGWGDGGGRRRRRRKSRRKRKTKRKTKRKKRRKSRKSKKTKRRRRRRKR